MFFRPWPAASLVAVEAVAVVGDRDVALAERTFADRHLGLRRVRVLADVREALLHDAEHLDLLVRREADRRVDFEVDLEHAVRRQELDVAAKRGVERRGAARGGEREDREARFLLCEQGSLLQARRDFLDRRARLEHRCVRRDGKEILREAVVDLARDARALLRDRAAELGEADRAPGADEDQRRTRACAGSRPARRRCSRAAAGRRGAARRRA